MKNNIIIVGESAPAAFVSELASLGKKIIKLQPLNNVNNLVCAHADTALCPIDDETVVVSPNLSKWSIAELIDAGIKVIKGETVLKEQYPHDIAYNVARVGKYAFAREKHIDQVLKTELLKREVTILDVKQGYASCSVMAVSDKAIISADKSIIKSARQTDLDVLLISEGNIVLEGAPYGFFGGCGGNIGENEICVCGTLTDHPDCNKIKEFCYKHGKTVTEIGDFKLTDIGSLF